MGPPGKRGGKGRLIVIAHHHRNGSYVAGIRNVGPVSARAKAHKIAAYELMRRRREIA
jgi:hypothetical protein